MNDIDLEITRRINSHSQEDLFKLIYKDDFGCLNRKYFELFCSLSRLDITNGNFSLMISDADSFKIINDSFGHAWGDLAIKKLFERAHKVTKNYSKSLDEVIRSIRFGGDEGLVISLSKSGETGMFEEVLTEASKTLLQPNNVIINESTGEEGLKNIQVQSSGGFVYAKDYLFLPREVFPTYDFVDAINEKLMGGVETSFLEEEGRETIISKQLTSSGQYRLRDGNYSDRKKQKFEYEHLGIERHQFESIVAYLTKLGYGSNRDFEIDDLGTSTLAGIPNLFAVAMTSEADNRLYQAKRALGGFCYGPNKIKSWDYSNLVLEDLTSEQILERSQKYEELKKKSDR